MVAKQKGRGRQCHPHSYKEFSPNCPFKARQQILNKKKRTITAKLKVSKQ